MQQAVPAISSFMKRLNEINKIVVLTVIIEKIHDWTRKKGSKFPCLCSTPVTMLPCEVSYLSFCMLFFMKETETVGHFLIWSPS